GAQRELEARWLERGSGRLRHAQCLRADDRRYQQRGEHEQSQDGQPEQARPVGAVLPPEAGQSATSTHPREFAGARARASIGGSGHGRTRGSMTGYTRSASRFIRITEAEKNT